MILIALGANLLSQYGEPLQTLYAAIEAIDSYDGISVVHRSFVYKSAPVPISDQPWYHNAVIAIDTELSPHALLRILHEIEEDFGRVRVLRNEARVLDLDIVAYGDLVLQDDRIAIPHPRMDQRAFVLLPVKDVLPEWKHPVSGRSVGEMIAQLPDGQDIERVEVKSDDAA